MGCNSSPADQLINETYNFGVNKSFSNNHTCHPVCKTVEYQVVYERYCRPPSPNLGPLPCRKPLERLISELPDTYPRIFASGDSTLVNKCSFLSFCTKNH